MKCPYCWVEFHDSPKKVELNLRSYAGCWLLNSQECPKCDQLILRLAELDGNVAKSVDVIWPKGSGPAPCPPEAKDVASDYDEACLILTDSPQAAAALGRRILQQILREKAKVT